MDSLIHFLVRVAPPLMEWAVILFPLALYLIWLGFDVCRRKQPAVIRGSKDAALLALALSGFFLIGPPTWVLDRYAQVGWKSYAVGFAIYLVVLGFLAWAWVQSRRRSLVIYSIDPEVFPPLIRQALDETGEKYQITPGRLALGANKLVIDLAASPSMYCVTLSWVGDEATWLALESKLRGMVVTVETKNNPAGAIIPLWAGLALMYCSMSTVIFVWYLAYMAM